MLQTFYWHIASKVFPCPLLQHHEMMILTAETAYCLCSLPRTHSFSLFVSPPGAVSHSPQGFSPHTVKRLASVSSSCLRGGAEPSGHRCLMSCSAFVLSEQRSDLAAVMLKPCYLCGEASSIFKEDLVQPSVKSQSLMEDILI